MKNLMYFKNDFVSKEAFSRENSQMGLRQFLASRVRNFLLRGAKILAFDIFFVVCWLSARGGSQENVSILSARGGPKIGLFSVSWYVDDPIEHYNHPCVYLIMDFTWKGVIHISADAKKTHFGTTPSWHYADIFLGPPPPSCQHTSKKM